jgi:DNA-binding IclR family transcriptional regulator
MKLSTNKRSDLIRRFLINSIKAGNAQFLQDAIETFQLSRQAIHNHLSALVDAGFLVASGNTRGRTYSLGSVRTEVCVNSGHQRFR